MKSKLPGKLGWEMAMGKSPFYRFCPSGRTLSFSIRPCGTSAANKEGRSLNRPAAAFGGLKMDGVIGTPARVRMGSPRHRTRHGDSEIASPWEPCCFGEQHRHFPRPPRSFASIWTPIPRGATLPTSALRHERELKSARAESGYATATEATGPHRGRWCWR